MKHVLVQSFMNEESEICISHAQFNAIEMYL